jgi:hypothetical protein
MRISKVLPIVILSIASSLAMANDKDKDCSEYNNDQKRQECRAEKYDDGNCSRFDNDRVRKECREHKYGHDGKVDCGKLDNDKLRNECREEKWD